MHKRFFFSILFSILSFAVQGQIYKTSLITINDGLSQSSALSIIQGKKGFIWIGTKDGLDRYDGINFKVYRHVRGKNSLINNDIKCLYQDKKGNIWIGTIDGLSKFNPEKEKFTSFRNNDSINMADNLITAILEDSRKNVWIGTANGLYKLILSTNSSGKREYKFERFTSGDKIFKEFNKQLIACLYEDSEENIWVGTSQENLYCISLSNGKIRKFLIDPSHKKKKIFRITSLVEFSKNKMLVGTYGAGVYYLDKRTKKFSKQTLKSYLDGGYFLYVVKIKKYKDIYYVLANRVLYKIVQNKDLAIWHDNHIIPSPTDFLIDNSGVIWIGSDGGGIVKMVPVLKNFNTITIKRDKKNGFILTSLRAFLKVNRDLFAGGYIGLLEAKNYCSDSAVVWNRIKAFNHFNVYSLELDPVDTNILWVGTEGYGLFRYNLKTQHLKQCNQASGKRESHFHAAYVYDMLIYNNKDIYFATNDGVSKYNRVNHTFTNFSHSFSKRNTLAPGHVLSLCEDSAGNIWMGTDRSGISIYNPKTHTFRNLQYHEDSTSLSNNRVNVIFKDRNNTIWVGTGDGLDKYSFKKNNFTVYTKKQGLPNDCIYGILQDSSGCLWLSTNKGLSKFNPKTNIFRNYDASYGLQSNEFNTAAYYKAANGEMFFGGIKGFTAFYPKEIIQNKYAPPVVITDFKKFNKSVLLNKSISYAGNIVLPYNDYFFSMKFTMPEYSNPLNHKFVYRLRGLSKKWITLTGGQNTASFSGVPPGKYTLEVRGANSDGLWTKKITRLKITIKPAYWQTWWFKIFVVGLTLLIVVLLFNSRISRLKKEEKIQKGLTKQLISSQEDERKNISYELHDDLGQNLLVVKNRLMLARKDQNFEDNINETLDVLDMSINEISNISHLLHPSELEELGLSQAVEAMIYRIESASELQIHNRLHGLDDYFMPEEKINIFRIIQEALNNVIKHSRATEVYLTNEIRGNDLLLSITDNGVGFSHESNEKDKRPHLGLKGMKERALMLNGVLKIESKPAHGTNISILFKNRTKK